MKVSEFKYQIKEDIRKSKSVVSEGIVDRILSAIIDKLVAKKAGKLFTALKNDPEYQESLLAVKRAVERATQATDRAIESKKKFDKEYDEYVKKYGKARADKIVAKVKKFTKPYYK